MLDKQKKLQNAANLFLGFKYKTLQNYFSVYQILFEHFQHILSIP